MARMRARRRPFTAPRAGRLSSAIEFAFLLSRGEPISTTGLMRSCYPFQSIHGEVHFPVPEDEQHESTDDFPGLIRAANLIGQRADINHLRKQTALFEEFRETGMSNKLKYNSVADLRANYPDFFWKTVRPYIGDALRYLQSHARGPTVDCQPLCRRVLGGA